MSSGNDIPGFDRLSSWVSYYSGTNLHPTSSNGNEAPSLIVLCSWVAASPKHIAKYTAAYQQLYPNASILVIQTWTYDVILRLTDGCHFARLEPARDITLSFIDANQDGMRAIHMFSNGGALVAGLLFTMLRSSRPKLRKDMFHALLFDSCPGDGEYRPLVRALTVSMKLHTYPWPIYAVASLVVQIGASHYLIGNALGIENTVDRIRKRLNDETLVDLRVPRLYLYSKVDELVDWEAVASHGLEARKKGYHVEEVVFQNSAHCAHLQEDARKYWDAVDNLVRTAGQTSLT
ncbi:hypothetical protein NM208_g6103 [Fusarium decemcellulare]|uniref:Uncharacterized protein n=1 Tax=Fusarium decemcellulare TaxID=57161 RepID=A0ACC1SEA9_9HYPO|nr:hypothetical protein NM208_g6103 [Fusarium decemcellulare]